MRKNCSSDGEKLFKFEAEGREEITRTNFSNSEKGRHSKQSSQGLVLGWILKNIKLRQQRRSAGEMAATTMVLLPAKNLPWRPW